MELKTQMLDSRNDVLRTNKLEKVTKMIISLNELDNSDNLEDGRPSNILFTYCVTSSECYMLFEPQTPRYKALKYGEIVSLFPYQWPHSMSKMSSSDLVRLKMSIKYWNQPFISQSHLFQSKVCRRTLLMDHNTLNKDML